MFVPSYRKSCLLEGSSDSRSNRSPCTSLLGVHAGRGVCAGLHGGAPCWRRGQAAVRAQVCGEAAGRRGEACRFFALSALLLQPFVSVKDQGDAELLGIPLNFYV